MLNIPHNVLTIQSINPPTIVEPVASSYSGQNQSTACFDC